MSKISIDIDMECLEKTSEEQRIFFLKALAGMACADGHFDECEKIFVSELAQDMHIYSVDINQIIENGVSKEALFQEAAKLNNRALSLELIKMLCLLSHMDDEMSDQETLFIGQIGQAMGIELEKIEHISNWVIDYLIWREQGKIIFEKV